MRQEINQRGALLLGAAIKKLFPHVEYEGSTVDPFDFRCAFYDAEKFDPSYLPLLENAMRELYEADIQPMEMIASNAAEFFSHLGQKNLAKQIEQKQGIISVTRIGDFADLGEEGRPCKTFSLLGYEQKKGKVVVFGVGFEDSRQKKTFIKKYRDYPKKKGSTLAKELELFEGNTWHPRGILLKKAFLASWEKVLYEHGFQEVSTPNPIDYHKTTSRKNFYLTNGEAFQFGSDISLLQIVEKWLIICGYRFQWVLRKAKKHDPLLKAVTALKDPIEVQAGEQTRLEARIFDGLGRSIPGLRIEAIKGGIKASFGDLQALITLFVEQHEGELPFNFAPEQVRLLPLEGVDSKSVTEIFNRRNIRYFVDRSKDLLKEKLHRGLRVKVPYVMVFGKIEETEKRISVRAYSSSQDMKMTLQEMETLLAERQFESK